MKTMRNLLKVLLIITGFLIILSSCKDKPDDNDQVPLPTGPTMNGISLSNDNELVTIDFSEGVYKGGVLNMPIGKDDLTLTLNGGSALLDSFRVNHTAGQNRASIRLYLDGLADGTETLQVKPSGPLAIVNSASVAMKETEQLGIALADIGIIGGWVSVGENLSPVYQQFGFDSVYMKYRGDGTYLFESFTTGGIHNVLTGTYQQSISPVAGFRLITLSQTAPVTATISGIFSLFDEDNIRMVYETVQTDPAVAGLTPPNPEAGFGSTGNLGSDNTQVFLRVSGSGK